MTETQVVNFLKKMKDDLIKGAGFETGQIFRNEDFVFIVAATVDGKKYAYAKPVGDDPGILRELRGKGSMHKVDTKAQPPILKAMTAVIQGEQEKIADIVIRNTPGAVAEFDGLGDETAWFQDIEGYVFFGLLKGNSKQLCVLPPVDEEQQEIPTAVLSSFKLLKGKFKAFATPIENLGMIQGEFKEYYGLEDEPDPEPAPAPATKPASKPAAKKAAPKQEQGAKAAVKEKDAKYPHEDGDENGMVWQVNYTGDELEPLPADVYINKIICATDECDNVRYLKNSDVFQCDRCKKCTMKARRARRYRRKQDRIKEAREAEAAAAK